MTSSPSGHAALLVLLCLMSTFTVACSRSGNSRLDRPNVDRIVEGVTTSDEIRSMLGRADRVTPGFRKSAVDEYLRTRFLIEPEATNLAEDDYEIWTYWFAASGSVPIPILGGLLPSRPVRRDLTLILSSQRVCVFKVYEERRM